MDFKWSDIYQDFLNCRERNCSEREFQHCIYSVFRYYLRWQNYIVAEEAIPIGAVNTIRPDFVLYKDELPQVVIESKEPNHSQVLRNRDQLFSYMRQKKVDFGLYIGEVIQLYYDVPSDIEKPLLICSLEYNKDSEFGRDFVRLFNYLDFDKLRLTEYCLNRLQDIQRKHDLDCKVEMLLSEEGNVLCHRLLKSHLISEGFSQGDVDVLMEDIEIVINRKSKLNPIESFDYEAHMAFSSQSDVVNGQRKKKPRRMYSINGKGAYCKNKSALELVRAYIADHPSTYQAICALFNGHVPNYVLAKREVDAKKRDSSDKNKSKRWHEDVPLKSSDGIIFYVTTQVGEGCPIDFNDIVSLASKLGYNIEPVY